ncbi:MAG: hypothetical protein ACP5PW_03260 [Candidatus Dormibacteria bacterium]
MRAAYRLIDQRNGMAVSVGWPGVKITGDLALAGRIERYLGDAPVVALGPSRNQLTGERGTRVWAPERGSWEWLRAALGQAAEELGLVMLVDIP